MNLIISLKKLGGKLKDSQVVVNFVKDCPTNYQTTLFQLGVEVRIVDRYDRRCPHANKLKMLDLADQYKFSLLIALDIDTVIVNDFSSLLTEDCLSAKIADGTPFSIEQWQKIFSFFRLPLPQQHYLTTTTYVPVIPYFNSGVLIIPVKYLASLTKYWSYYLNLLLDLHQLDSQPFFVDQIALSLALPAGDIPVRPLPLALNFPTHVKIHPALHPHQINPYILHYHNRITPQSLLQKCPYHKTNQTIASVNKVITQSEHKKGEFI